MMNIQLNIPIVLAVALGAVMLMSFSAAEEAPVKDLEKSDLEFYCGEAYKAPISKRRVNPIMLKVKGVKSPVQVTAEKVCNIDATVTGKVPDDAVFTFNTVKDGKGMYFYVELDDDEIEIYYRNAGDSDWDNYAEIEVHGDHIHLDREVELPK